MTVFKLAAKLCHFMIFTLLRITFKCRYLLGTKLKENYKDSTYIIKELQTWSSIYKKRIGSLTRMLSINKGWSWIALITTKKFFLCLIFSQKFLLCSRSQFHWLYILFFLWFLKVLVLCRSHHLTLNFWIYSLPDFNISNKRKFQSILEFSRRDYLKIYLNISKIWLYTLKIC